MMHPLFQQLLSPFMSPQKTAKQIQEIDIEREAILIEHWEYTFGWFEVALHKGYWSPQTKCFIKQFRPWDFEEYCEKQGYTWENYDSFEKWLYDWNKQIQRQIVTDFIRIHDTTLQVELDNYYNK